MTDIDVTRVFAISAFEGLRALRLRRVSHPYLSLADLAHLVRQVDPDGGSHDFEAAFHLEIIVATTAPATEASGFYRHCIEAAIPAFRPLWGRIITLGRRKFEQKLSRDEAQCFRSAGLLDVPPTPEIIGWWDRVAGHARLRADQEKMARARQAEQLSLEYEAWRLARLAIGKDPIWMAIEDNTAGYDIHSFDIGTDEPVNRLIEVKSTIMSPLRFRLTRHEWDTAVKYGTAYNFHIWNMQALQLYELSVADILPHVPTDNERGKWENVEIPVMSSVKSTGR